MAKCVSVQGNQGLRQGQLGRGERTSGRATVQFNCWTRDSTDQWEASPPDPPPQQRGDQDPQFPLADPSFPQFCIFVAKSTSRSYLAIISTPFDIKTQKHMPHPTPPSELPENRQISSTNIKTSAKFGKVGLRQGTPARPHARPIFSFVFFQNYKIKF